MRKRDIVITFKELKGTLKKSENSRALSEDGLSAEAYNQS